ncbi:hypothetical protein OHA72_55715 [Dactylosporangium sp. NBC_01737]|uniref:WXG100 family type VII secretion target n=1 Tax=Dactylosporangium sp. NBC_01737 TaxID=2975959 RepID=UPI002E157C11|nr:hypothetical protein OHA72_55715 [Dactylosporangium sp. NBC_01737]
MGDETDPSSFTDKQYTEPTKSQDGGWFGDSYANEGDPSWEDVIAMVVIPGSPARIKQAADEWTALLSRLAEVERVLKAVKSDLETWKGAGGDQYRSHLDMMTTSIQKVIDDNTNLPHYLHLAAGDLESAIAKIPIPDDMIAEVMAAKQGYIDHGMISDTWGPNAIYQYLLPVYGNKWFDEAREFFTWDWASNKLRDWISSQDNKAKDAYHQLAKQHVNTMAQIPGSDPVGFNDPREPAIPDTFGGPPGGGGGGMPKTKIPGGLDPKLGGDPNLDDMTNPPGTNLTDPNLTNPGGYDPDDLPGTGLAGAGGGLVGAGPGAGGLGAGAGGIGPGSGGLGAGGLGASGLGRGAGGMGGGMGAGMMPGMGMGGAGAGRGAGRGVTGAGAGKGGVRGAGAGAGRGGAGGLRGGMMPGAGGAHGGGEGEDHTTWLQEDEDPWGSDSEAPPSVLG